MLKTDLTLRCFIFRPLEITSDAVPEDGILQVTYSSWRWCAAFVIGLWSVVFLMTCPPLFNAGVRYALEPSGISCCIDYWHPGQNSGFALYIGILTIFAYIIPIITMIVCMANASNVLRRSNLVKR